MSIVKNNYRVTAKHITDESAAVKEKVSRQNVDKILEGGKC